MDLFLSNSKKWIYKWFPIIFGCHCRDDRSFYYKGQKFPICARCTGEFVGICFALICCFFFRLTAKASFIIMIPLIIDGFTQALTSYESNNIKRFITGVLFGSGIFMLFVISTIIVFNFGVNIGTKYNIGLRR